MQVLKPQHEVVGIPHDSHVAFLGGSPPILHPLVQNIVKIDIGQQRGDHRSLWCSPVAAVYHTFLAVTCLQPFENQPLQPPVAYAQVNEPQELIVWNFVEKRTDVRVNDPVHFPPLDGCGQSVQCIVLALSRTEPVGKAEHVCIVHCHQHRTHRLLDYLVLHTGLAQRTHCPVVFSNVRAQNRGGPIALFAQPVVKSGQVTVQILCVVVPSHSVQPRRGLAVELVEALAQQLRGEVVFQVGEAQSPIRSGFPTHAFQSDRRPRPALRPVGGFLSGVPLGRGPFLRRLRRGRRPLAYGATADVAFPLREQGPHPGAVISELNSPPARTTVSRPQGDGPTLAGGSERSERQLPLPHALAGTSRHDSRHGEWLALPCKTLSFSTFCRFESAISPCPLFAPNSPPLSSPPIVSQCLPVPFLPLPSFLRQSRA